VKVRALVVGLGSIGQRHARNLRSLLGEDLVLSALRSGRGGPVVTSQLGAQAGDPAADCDGGVFSDLEQALASRPGIVVVCNPTSLHVGVVAAAVRAGAAVFVEKPLSHGPEGLDELAALVAEREAVVAVGCQLRFHPALLAAHALLEQRALGRLIRVHAEVAEYLPSFHPYEDYRQSYAARADLGGGVALTQIHEIDYLRWFFGMPASVFAVGGHLSELEIDVEDSASALLSCEVDGAPLAVHVHLDYLQRPASRTCSIRGVDGAIELDLRRPSLRFTDSDGQVVREERFEAFERNDMFLDEMRHFLAATRHEHPVAVSLQDGIDAVRIAVAIGRSLRSGELEQPAFPPPG
jgi:predicted dehydrogenase